MPSGCSHAATIAGNDASGGGGLYVRDSIVSLDNCLLFSNSAANGGGLAIFLGNQIEPERSQLRLHLDL